MDGQVAELSGLRARREVIADWLRADGELMTADIAQRFGVSRMTARRDLQALQRTGVARCTHGGAVVPSLSEPVGFEGVVAEADCLTLVAVPAAALVPPASTVVVDASPFGYAVARELVRRRLGATLVSHSVAVMNLVAPDADAGIALVGLGGSFDASTLSFCGVGAVAGLERHCADYAFLQAGVNRRRGWVYDGSAAQAEVKAAMVACAERAVVLPAVSARGGFGITSLDSVWRVLG